MVTLFFIWPEQQKSKNDAVVTINGRTLTKQFFQNHRERDPGDTDSENYVETIITKQLLLAEAQRRHIDQQPEFRLALKTLYENSLIELLQKQVNNEIKTTVSKEEVNNYLLAFGKTYTFYILKTTRPVAIESIVSQGTKYVSRFEELGSALRQSLATMKTGNVARTYAFSRDTIAIYLEKVEGETILPPDFDTEKIKNQLQQIKKEKYFNTWLEKLRGQAEISYHINQE